MIEKIYIIAYPMAGFGKGRQVLNQVRQELQALRIPHLTYETEYAQHAVSITKQLVTQQFDPNKHRLAVIGGDGTLSEVINTLLSLSLKIPITYFAAGTGNDFYRARFNEASVPDMIDRMLYQRQAKHIPIGYYQNKSQHKVGYFINSYGFGFDAEVIHSMTHYNLKEKLNRFKLSHLSYFFAVFLALKDIKTFSLDVNHEGSQQHFENCGLVLMMNHPFVGGGIQIAPQFDPHQKDFSLYIFHHLNFKVILNLIWNILFSHKAINSNNLTHLRGNQFELWSPQIIRSEYDGELNTSSPIHCQFKKTSYPFFI